MMHQLTPTLLLTPLLLAFASASSSLPSSSHSSTSLDWWPTPPTPILPTKDEFYSSRPENLEFYKPGDIIRIRSAPGKLTSLFPASSAHQILYRTAIPSSSSPSISFLAQKEEKEKETPTWALTTLLVPSSPLNSSSSSSSSSSHPPILSYQQAYNTASLNGAASYTLSLLSHANETQSLADISSALSRGWIVATPDFESVESAFLAGGLEGRAVLDGVRAVRNFLFFFHSTTTTRKEKKKEKNNKWAMWGYSGGSLATGFAGEALAAGYYAAAELVEEELELKGMVLGGLPVGVESVLDNVDATPYAGLIPQGTLGVTALSPRARGKLIDSLVPETAGMFLAALNMSIAETVPAFAGVEMGGYFKNGTAALHADYLSALMQGAELGRERGGKTVSAPIFAYKSVYDEFSHVELSDELINKYCEAGARVRYDRNTVDGGHLSEFQDGHSRALDFIADRFAEVPFHEGCVVRNVSVVDPTGGYIGEDW